MTDTIYERTFKEFDSVKKLVEGILAKDEQARNSDQWLIYKVISEICRIYDKKMYIPFELFQNFPAYESVTRCRRKLNEEGKYLPTDQKVIERRRGRERAVRDWVKQDVR